MKNFEVVIIFILILTTLNSCGTVKDAFSTQKKIVPMNFQQKKKSFKITTDFDELPIPNQDSDEQNDDEDELKELLITSEDSTKINQKAQSQKMSLQKNSYQKKLNKIDVN